MTLTDTEKLTEDRGALYGHPKIDFGRVTGMAKFIDDCPDQLARHALYMVLVKVARLVETPSHKDSWDDIQGYARTGKMVMGLEE
jgi:hypothetical protein